MWRRDEPRHASRLVISASWPAQQVRWLASIVFQPCLGLLGSARDATPPRVNEPGIGSQQKESWTGAAPIHQAAGCTACGVFAVALGSASSQRTGHGTACASHHIVRPTAPAESLGATASAVLWVLGILTKALADGTGCRRQRSIATSALPRGRTGADTRCSTSPTQQRDSLPCFPSGLPQHVRGGRPTGPTKPGRDWRPQTSASSAQ
jgi:hypothetical protein